MGFHFVMNINGGTRKYENFDAGYRFRNVMTLCDGANSCKKSGIFATNLSKRFSKNFHLIKVSERDRVGAIRNITTTLNNESIDYFAGGASTLVSLAVNEKDCEIVSVGDSYAQVYIRNNFQSWELFTEMPRDVDSKGNPWQLIGTDLFERVNYQIIDRKKDLLILMMSDGVGNYIDERDIIFELNSIGESINATIKLKTLLASVIRLSEERGSFDDKSACVASVEGKN